MTIRLGGPDQRHAATVALGLLVPGTILLVRGHPELMLYAVFGSFTGMYGRLEPPRLCLWHQFHGAGMLVTGVAIGGVLAGTGAAPGVLVATVIAFSILASLVTDALRVRPGGPFFGIFALGATAMVGPHLVTWWVGLGICAATAVFAMVLRLVLGLLEPRSEPDRAPLADQLGWDGAVVPHGAAVRAVRYAVATGIAGMVGLLAGVDRANWAMAAAAVPLAVVSSGEPLDLRAVVDRGVHRVLGTLLGLAVTSVVLLLEPSGTVLAAIVMALLFPTELFMSRHYGVALGFFTPLIMIMTDLADPADPITMVLARGADTLLGVAAGITAAALVGGRLPGRPGPDG